MINVVDCCVQFLVTNNPTWKVYPRQPEGDTFPCVIIAQLSGVSLNTLKGPSKTFRGRIQLDCIGRTYTDAKALADILTLPVRDGGFLNGYVGTWGSPTMTIQGCHVENEMDHEYPPKDGNDVAKYCTSVHLIVWYERSA